MAYRKSSFLNFLKDDVLGSGNRMMAFFWVVGVVLILGVGIYLNTEATTFLGVAESHESPVNFDAAVEIQTLHVIPGDHVKKGDLLVEVRQAGIQEREQQIQALLLKLQAELRVRNQMNAVISGRNSEVVVSDPLQVEIQSLQVELKFMDEKKRSLYSFAELDGVIGTVNFRQGEKVPAYQPILTVHPVHPNYVSGYIHESLHSSLRIGQRLKVSSLTGSVVVMGRVVSLASKMSAIPERLSKVVAQASWGREVIIEIPEQNDLLMSEKVRIQAGLGFVQASVGLSSAIAEATPVPTPEKTLMAENFTVADIILPRNLREELVPEPSGLVYLADLRRYLMIDDEQSHILLMDANGRVSEQVLQVKDMPDVSDLESISSDGSFIYLLSSQSRRPSGKLYDKRQKLIRLTRDDLNLQFDAEVVLRPLLLEAMAKSQEPALNAVAAQAEIVGRKADDLEIEAHGVHEGSLLLALKNPKMAGRQILFVQVQNIDRVFSTKSIPVSDVRIWKILELPDAGDGEDHSISDFIVRPEVIYFSTTCRGKFCGALWKVDRTGSAPKLIKLFNNGKLEGLALDLQSKKLIGVFDQDGRTPQFFKVNVTLEPRTDNPTGNPTDHSPVPPAEEP